MSFAWQPIVTAPKGDVILYYPPVYKEGRGKTHKERIAIGRADETPYRRPTHWMPLPDRPSAYASDTDLPDARQSEIAKKAANARWD